MKRIFLIIGSIVFLLFSGQAAKLSKQNLAAIYSEDAFTHFKTIVFHVNDSVSTIFMSINLGDMAYVPDSTGGKPMAIFSISYQLFDSYDARYPVDSTTMRFTDTDNYGKDVEIVVDFDLKVTYPSESIVLIALADMNKPENKTLGLTEIHKTNRFSAQNFFLTDENGYPLFGQTVSENRHFSFICNDTTQTNVIIRYYHQDFPLALPPFTVEKNKTFEFEPDSFYTVSLINGVSPQLGLPYPGIYHFQLDKSIASGFTLFRFGNEFPEVNTPEDALSPLRYLTTQREFEKLESYRDYKVAIDSFWLERASYKPDRAKGIIRKFYSRVELSNQLFTSYQEGWQTDRGLIYIIYGPPTEVYSDDKQEEWIYGERGNPLSINFFFRKTENPFTFNDYILERSLVYKTSWYIAIENWRR